MEYVGIVTREGKHWLVEFPQAPGCQTFAESRERLAIEAQDALEGWLGSWLVTDEAPPEQKRVRVPAGSESLVVRVPARLATAVTVRWARLRAGLTQAALASRLAVTKQAVQKLEKATANPSVETLEKVASALGGQLEVRLSI